MDLKTPILSGYSRIFTDQIEALVIAYQEALYQLPSELWTWGGGTVLALYYFHHRKSFDIDIFIHDPQVFTYLSPKWILDNAESDFSYEYQETANHIQLVTSKSHIKVDFILSPPILPHHSQKNTLLELGFDFYVETIEAIIARKLRFRRKQNVARDIFDTAVALTRKINLLETLYHARVLTIEDLVEWDTALQALDQEHYERDIEMISPDEEMRHIETEAKTIITDSIAKLKKAILSERIPGGSNTL